MPKLIILGSLPPRHLVSLCRSGKARENCVLLFIFLPALLEEVICMRLGIVLSVIYRTQRNHEELLQPACRSRMDSQSSRIQVSCDLLQCYRVSSAKTGSPVCFLWVQPKSCRMWSRCGSKSTTNEELCGNVTRGWLSMPIIELESLRYETGVLSTQWQLRRNMKISQNGKHSDQKWTEFW